MEKFRMDHFLGRPVLRRGDWPLGQREETFVILEFWVPGNPRPGGSKRGYPIRTGKFKINQKTGKPQEIIRVNVVEDSKHNKEWRADVVNACRQAYQGRILEGPLRVDFEFFFLRPKNHFGTGKNAQALKPSADKFPQGGQADRTKLLRSTEDALNGVLWRDDKQIVCGWVSRLYGNALGAKIRVEEL
jgi:Holliday junction resolvase RusA-like endonuclease